MESSGNTTLTTCVKEPRRKTLRDFRLFTHPSEDHPENINIWNFSTRSWTPWLPEANKEAAQAILWRGARTIAKLLHFCSHQCLVGTVREYIPDEYVHRVFQPTEWAYKFTTQHALFNSDVLKKAVENKILPRWKEHNGYPVHQEAPLTVQEEPNDPDKTRMAFFEERARSDNAALTIFMAPLLEPMDWKTICAQNTAADKQIYEWSVYSLASAANIVSRLLGNRENVTKSAAGHDRNPRWLAVGNTPNRPTYEMIPLAENFWPLPSVNIGGVILGEGEADENPLKSKRRRMPLKDAPAKKRQLAAKAVIPPLPSSIYKPSQMEAPEKQGHVDSLKIHPAERSTAAYLPRHHPHLQTMYSISKSPEPNGQGESNELSTVPKMSPPQASSPRLHDHQTRPHSPPPKAPSMDKAPPTEPQLTEPNNHPTLATSNQRSSATPPPRTKSPNLTTPKVSHWDSEDLTGFLTRMKISADNITMFCSYDFPQKGKLTGEVLLTLTNEEVNDEKLEIEGPEERRRLWRVVNKLHARVQKNDRELGAVDR
ncbi:uncharacterized protein BP5553_01505 [Venustampulla echinocandica]|uniref:SAM domain-containing protein n=1 Tax=Venustampulla echinocandica TaxID=2656787 RepID=A0A370U172_9HELO|nr:uncharacterized protein BP5553_01505 [Venustampulla echinocandica]RDL41526.1 hypothetical protein BP5553_01505 [Venustampulla echinocandica]